METNIEAIIINEQIDTLYQPIVNLITGEVMGYEALSRGPKESPYYSPIDLIDAAEKEGLSNDLEYVLRKKAIQNLEGLETNQRLFININPKIMSSNPIESAKIRHALEKKGLKPNNVVLELT